jgi:hypothetical protein
MFEDIPFHWQAAGAFGCMFLLDVIWVFYTKAVVAKAPERAAIWCAALTMANALSAVLYVRNPWLIIPAVLGAAVGTWVAMRLGHAQEA